MFVRWKNTDYKPNEQGKEYDAPCSSAECVWPLVAPTSPCATRKTSAYVVNGSTETRCSTFTQNHLSHAVTYGAKTDEQSGIYMAQKYIQ